MSVDYTFITTVKNRQQLLDRCLESILWQDCSDFEAIVVDYGSQPAVMVPGDPRIRVVRIEPDGDGWNGSVALNAGIANAGAEKLVLLNCDCLVAPDMLSAIDGIIRNRDNKLQIYWRRFDLAPSGQRLLESVSERRLFSRVYPPLLVALGLGRWHVLVDHRLVKSCPKRLYDFLVALGLRKWHRLTAYGDFLAVDKAPLMEIGGFDERMAGWGRMDLDAMERLKMMGYQVFWGRQFKLIHQHHAPQEGQRESNKSNTKLSLRELAAGRIVRNGGIQNFERYRR